MNIIIRKETQADYQVTESVVKQAFDSLEFSDQKEHELVSRVRQSDAFIPELSLVAVLSDRIVGHILLSRITIRGDQHTVDSLALAPVSVLPEYQALGIGKKLIREALQLAVQLGYSSVIVMGHPQYYPKFGFKKASIWGIQPPIEVPDEVFMALQLQEHALDHASGVVQYPSEFFE
ncbi:GNAT family N-acetyltransferase [Paenibacillus alvei]|uniref:GNAT family N-acetyltransferase n=1 Tax=Paenibacillus alvei TaxID=44250 RepID=UPI002282CE99|nr:N-acetyltransferase [Paenibacillus alvei]